MKYKIGQQVIILDNGLTFVKAIIKNYEQSTLSYRVNYQLPDDETIIIDDLPEEKLRAFLTDDK